MPSLTTILLFSGAALALLVVPGPAVLYIVSQSLAHGRRAGLVSMLGIETGGLIHVLAAAAGLSAVLASSATAFTIVKYVGAAYLVLLGLLRIFRGSETYGGARAGAGSRRMLFQGVVVNVLNPKTALFFLAFLPQFVRDGHGPATLQILFLGVLFLVLATISDGIYALLAGSASSGLRRTFTGTRLSRYVSGGVLAGLGVAAAFTSDGS